MHKGTIPTDTREQLTAGYPPPGQGFAPPGTGFAPPGTGFAPPDNAYPPPAYGQGFAPPGTGFAPPGSGFAPPGPGFSQPSPPAYPPPPYAQPPPPPDQGYPPPPPPVYNQPTPVGIVVLPDNAGHQRTPPPDWTILAVVACIFCAWPCGLVAILASRSAKQAHEEGDYVSARAKADNAKKLIIFSVMIGIFCYTYIIYSQVLNVTLYD